MTLRVEEFARQLSREKVNSVRSASALKTVARRYVLPTVFEDPSAAQEFAAQTKSFILDNLKSLLIEFEENCLRNGVHVHWARDAAEANRIILDLCRDASPNGGIIAKAKSMATEEIHLNDHLIEAGYTPVETDLGEFVAQIDGDTPSHIVTPIIHKNRREIAESFEREKLGPYSEVPEELAMQAREHLRDQFRQAVVGISGVNFGISSTGRLVLVENEGNNRYSTTQPRVHIALMGIEKLLPTESDLAVFLPLLAGSATGQRITSYVHFIKGPRQSDELDGPDAVHLVLLDNGRTKVLNGPYREILRCIRCGACLNVCPVYRQASGHAYGHVYPGPVGAVLVPAMNKEYLDLAKASTLCGACQEVCPVKIPIPEMLLELRHEQEGSSKLPWKQFRFGADHPRVWRAGLTMLPMASSLPHPLKKKWQEFRELPEPQEKSFRRWWRDRS